jgi:hypothetical protein
MNTLAKIDLRDLYTIFSYADQFQGEWFIGYEVGFNGRIQFDGTIRHQTDPMNRTIVAERIAMDDQQAAQRVCEVVNFIHQLQKRG